MEDLEALKATIGGFHIGKNSIHSGNKNSIDSTERGIYFDSNGQSYFGDNKNFIRFYRSDKDNYKLQISADSLTFGSGVSVEKAFEDIKGDIQNAQSTADTANNKIDNLEIGGRNLLKQYIWAGRRCEKIDDLTIKVGTEVGDTYFYLRSHCALTAGETYTISCEASNVPDGCNWSFGVRTQSSAWQLYINKNGKNFATGVLDADVDADTDFILDDMNGRPLTAPNIILTNFKLEKGNRATD